MLGADPFCRACAEYRERLREFFSELDDVLERAYGSADEVCAAVRDEAEQSMGTYLPARWLDTLHHDEEK